MKLSRLLLIPVLLSGCAVTVPLGENSRYGRLIVGYELPPALHARHGNGPVEWDGKAVRW